MLGTITAMVGLPSAMRAVRCSGETGVAPSNTCITTRVVGLDVHGRTQDARDANETKEGTVRRVGNESSSSTADGLFNSRQQQ